MGPASARAADDSRESLGVGGAATSRADKKKVARNQAYKGLDGLGYSLSPSNSTSTLSLTGSTSSLSHPPSKYLLPRADIMSSSVSLTTFGGAIGAGFGTEVGQQAEMDRWPAGMRDPQAKARELKAAGAKTRELFSRGTLRHSDDAALLAASSKPKFLQDLEQYIAAELRLLHVNDLSQPSATRLAVYREAFARFSSDFHTYKPLLSRILFEYDTYLSSLESQIRSIPEYKRKVDMWTGEKKREIEEVEQRWRDRIEQVEREKEEQIQRVAALEGQVEELKQSNAATFNELSTLQSTHAALVVSNTTLKRALQRYGSAQHAAYEEKIAEVDLNKRLQASLTEQQRNHEALMQEMALLRVHASAVQAMNPVEYARLQQENADLKLAVKAEQDKFAGRSAEYHNLLALYEGAAKERATMQEEKQVYERMRLSSTPRPEWPRLLQQHYLPSRPTSSCSRASRCWMRCAPRLTDCARACTRGSSSTHPRVRWLCTRRR